MNSNHSKGPWGIAFTEKLNMNEHISKIQYIYIPGSAPLLHILVYNEFSCVITGGSLSSISKGNLPRLSVFDVLCEIKLSPEI